MVLLNHVSVDLNEMGQTNSFSTHGIIDKKRSLIARFFLIFTFHYLYSIEKQLLPGLYASKYINLHVLDICKKCFYRTPLIHTAFWKYKFNPS